MTSDVTAASLMELCEISKIQLNINIPSISLETEKMQNSIEFKGFIYIYIYAESD